uniref:Uncharacterized protein n=1 Tax=Meloidogyne floridensis TaxID=298350 RepID=A0A915NGB9_9BILA
MDKNSMESGTSIVGAPVCCDVMKLPIKGLYPIGSGTIIYTQNYQMNVCASDYMSSKRAYASSIISDIFTTIMSGTSICSNSMKTTIIEQSIDLRLRILQSDLNQNIYTLLNRYFAKSKVSCDNCYAINEQCKELWWLPDVHQIEYPTSDLNLGKYLHAESPFRATKEIKTYSLYAIIV